MWKPIEKSPGGGKSSLWRSKESLWIILHGVNTVVPNPSKNVAFSFLKTIRQFTHILRLFSHKSLTSKTIFWPFSKSKAYVKKVAIFQRQKKQRSCDDAARVKKTSSFSHKFFSLCFRLSNRCFEGKTRAKICRKFSHLKICHFSFSLPISITGAVGAMVQKELTFCGGSLEAAAKKTTASKDSYASECYKWTSEGWQRHKSMTKPRAFAASAWVITRDICTVFETH